MCVCLAAELTSNSCMSFFGANINFPRISHGLFGIYWNPGHRNRHRRVQAQREEFPENVSASERPRDKSWYGNVEVYSLITLW